MPATFQSEPPPGFWASVREALRGTHQDFTAGSLNRSILLLAIPMVLEMVLESLFAVVDMLAECSIAVASVILFRRGRWKTQRI